MKKKEIRKLAEEKINLGKSRQETFEELFVELKQPPEDIAKIVRFIPSLAMRDRFRALNVTLGVLIIIMALLRTIGGLPLVIINGWGYLPLLLLFPAAYVSFAVGIFRFRGQHYRVILFLTILTLLRVIGKVFGETFDPYILIDIGFALLLIVLSAILMQKLASSYELKKVWYTAYDGKRKIKQVIKFPEEKQAVIDTLDSGI